jgi:hypothetical protein
VLAVMKLGYLFLHDLRAAPKAAGGSASVQGLRLRAAYDPRSLERGTIAALAQLALDRSIQERGLKPMNARTLILAAVLLLSLSTRPALAQFKIPKVPVANPTLSNSGLPSACINEAPNPDNPNPVPLCRFKNADYRGNTPILRIKILAYGSSPGVGGELQYQSFRCGMTVQQIQTVLAAMSSTTGSLQVRFYRPEQRTLECQQVIFTNTP